MDLLAYLLHSARISKSQSVTACALCRPVIIIMPVEGTSVHLHCHNSACPHWRHFMYCFSAALVPSVLSHCFFSARKSIRPVKMSGGAGVVISLQ